MVKQSVSTTTCRVKEHPHKGQLPDRHWPLSHLLTLLPDPWNTVELHRHTYCMLWSQLTNKICNSVCQSGNCPLYGHALRVEQVKHPPSELTLALLNLAILKQCQWKHLVQYNLHFALVWVNHTILFWVSYYTVIICQVYVGHVQYVTIPVLYLQVLIAGLSFLVLTDLPILFFHI